MLLNFLQNQEQMRLNIGKTLKTASLNSRFTGSKKEECTSTCSLSKNFETLRPAAYAGFRKGEAEISESLGRTKI